MDSRASGNGEVIRRRRECAGCERRYTTYERVEEVLPMVVKKDGRRELFDRQKLLAGLRVACSKRPVSVEALDALAEGVERELTDGAEGREVASSVLGERVMGRLRELDEVAYVRFASVYRQFRDMDELAVALIDLSGRSLRKIIGQARQRATTERSVVRGSLETFMEQLRADDKLLHVLLREGTVGSDAFKQAVDRELNFFEEELQIDLVRLAAADHARLYEPALVAKAITRLVFAAGASAMDMPPEKDPELIEQLSHMLRMIITGSRAIAKADSK